MSTFGGLDRSIKDVDLVFFRGTKDELKAACSGDGAAVDQETVTITVIQNKGAKDEETKLLQAPAGTNVRQLLVDAGSTFTKVSRDGPIVKANNCVELALSTSRAER
jgi:hypothetical protein